MEESGPVSNKLGKGIIALRKENGLNQVQFAERVGISQTYVSDLESGKKNPTMRTLDDLLSCFDTDYIEFAQTYILDKTSETSVVIGENIKRLRINKGWKQKELAEASSISRESIGNYERGTRVPPVDIAFRLAKSLGVNVGELIGETEETNTTEEYYTLFDLLNEENQKQATDFVEFLISKQRSK